MSSTSAAPPREGNIPFYSAFVRPDGTSSTQGHQQNFFDKIPLLFKGNEGSSPPPTAPSTSPSRGASLKKEEEESGGLFSFAKRGVEMAQEGISATFTGVQQRTEEASFFLTSPRLPLFLCFAGAGVFFMFLAFLFLPMIVLAPQKFALLFTLGSVCLVVSLGVIKGFHPLLQHFLAKEKVPFSVAYFVSLILTLYTALFARSYLLTFFFSIVQIITLVSFLVSYVPGGTACLKMVRQRGVETVKSFFTFSSRRNTNTPLPR